MAKVRVVTDSASDLPDEISQRLGIDVVPLTIRFGEEEFTDRKDLSPDEFWAKCKGSKVLPETAAPSPGAFQQVYEAAAANGYDGVIVVALSSQLSATHQSAVLGAEAVTNTIAVRVIDSRAVSMAQGFIAMELADSAAKGTSLDELEQQAADLVQRTGVTGTIDTLEHLIKGGRVKGAKALLGSVLSIKPLLELKDGLVNDAGRQRTRSKAVAACVAAAEAAAPLRRIALVHGSASDVAVAEKALAEVKSEFPLIVANMGSVVGTHGGPGIICVCWLRA